MITFTDVHFLVDYDQIMFFNKYPNTIACFIQDVSSKTVLLMFGLLESNGIRLSRIQNYYV
jgi:hypothetical protein